MTADIDYRLLLARRQLMSIELKRVRKTSSLVKQEVAQAQQALIDLASSHMQLADRAARVRIGRRPVPIEPREALSGWVPVDLQLAQAWKTWIEEHRPNLNSIAASLKSDKLQIAFLMGGGLGDLLKAITLLPSLVQTLDCAVHVFYDNPIANEILRDNPYVTSVTVLKQNPHDYARHTLVHLPLYDLVVSWRYVANYALTAKSIGNPSSITSLIDASTREGSQFKKYHLVNDLWPTFNNGFSRDMEQAELSVIDVSRKTSGLPVGANPPIPFVPTRSSLTVTLPHQHRPYVTIHHGFDPNFLPDKTIRTRYGSTKNISTGQWKLIVQALLGLDVDVIQLGTAGEEVLEHTTYNYLGLTDFSETAMLIKGAVCHVDTEGGLVHVARAVHTPCVVMFGPTSVQAFGYPRNINLQAQSCNACWFTTSNWVVQCPRLTEGPQCMAEHRPDVVITAVRRILDANAGVEIQIESLPSMAIDSLVGMLDRRGSPARGLPPQLLVVRDATISMPDLEATGSEAVVTQVVTVGERAGDKHYVPRFESRNAVLASPYNLPQETASFDVVVAITAEWGEAEVGPLLREMLRVLKDGGTLLACTGGDDHTSIDVAAMLKDRKLEARSEASACLGEPISRLKIIKRTTVGSPVGHESLTAPLLSDDPLDDQQPLRALGAKLQDEVTALRDQIHRDLSLIHLGYHRRERLNAQRWSLRSRIAALRAEPGGWIETSQRQNDHNIQHYLLENWHTPDDWQVWGRGSRHSMLLPIPSEGEPGSLEVELAFNLPLTPSGQPRRLLILAGSREIAAVAYENKLTTARFVVPRSLLIADHVALLELDVEHSVTPAIVHQGSHDWRTLGLGLTRFRYRKVKQDERLQSRYDGLPDGGTART